MYGDVCHQQIQSSLTTQQNIFYFLVGPAKSGKKYTLKGENDKGILFRAVEELSKEISEKLKIYFSMYCFYNNTFIDL